MSLKTGSAIVVEGLGKLYKLSHRIDHHGSLREAITAAMAAPWRRFRSLSGSDTSMEEFWAVKDVSFDVPRGQVVGIIGRNGAGKSTLLKMLSRIVEPTEGSATMRGRVASLLEVGTGFHPELSGRENIYMNGSILGMKKREIDARFDEIVAFAEIEKFLDTPVKRYSSGMYVRLAFAVAAHLEPEILIVDEVLAVGDAEFQKRCLGKMKQISEGGGRTVLFVSHNMAAVRTLCSRGILLAGGRVHLSGTADVVVDAYLLPDRATKSTKALFGRPTGARIWMTETEILADGVPSASFSMGARVSLSVRFATEIPTRHPRFGWVLQSAGGERLLNSNNRYQESPAFGEPASAGTISCDLGMVPLMPGRYILSFWLGDTAGDHHVELEAMTFEVTERDLWGLGQLPPPTSFCWWPTTYRLSADS
jgi:lipopolysaccharide transport system ATP-binding protein